MQSNEWNAGTPIPDMKVTDLPSAGKVLDYIPDPYINEIKTITLTKGNIERFKQLQQQIQILNNEVNNLVAVILDAKEVEFKDKKISLSEDFTTITVE